MKGKGIVIAVVGLMIAAVPAAQATYTSIAHNLINLNSDTSYTGGVLTISASDSNNLSLFDPGPATLPGTITNASILLTTTFNQIIGLQAQFVGGSLTLTFDYDDGGGPVSYEISGPITGMLFDPPQQIGPNWKIDGLGRWTAATKNLPGSGIWPDGGGFSSIDSLTIDFDDDLSNFDWVNDVFVGRAETLYSLFPNDSAIPEPSTVLLGALGVVALLRRRR